MKPTPRALVATTSVVTIFGVTFVAWSLAPAEPQVYLSICLLVVGGTAISSVVAEPRELFIALLFAAMPILALAGEGTASWAMGPLAAALLVGAELNSWSWELHSQSSTSLDGRRAGRIALLGGGTLLASLAVIVAAQWTVATGLGAVLITGVALLAVARLVLGGSPEASQPLDVHPDNEVTAGHEPAKSVASSSS